MNHIALENFAVTVSPFEIIAPSSTGIPHKLYSSPFTHFNRVEETTDMKLQATQRRIALVSWVKLSPEAHSTQAAPTAQPPNPAQKFDLLRPLRTVVDRTQVRNPELAHRLCKLIPSQCPFERDVKVLGKTLFHIPPMCKLNPLYNEVVSLRFRAMCYLADECGEDISCYC